MRRFLMTALLAWPAVALAQDAPATTIVLDVPPCHYAAASVKRLAELGILRGFPASRADLARNALQQVFEGLKCGDIAWTTQFLAGVPQGYATGIPLIGRPLKVGFDLTLLETRVKADAATVRFRLAYREGSRAVQHTGTARLVPDAQTGWRVEFASLAGRGLSFFP